MKHILRWMLFALGGIAICYVTYLGYRSSADAAPAVRLFAYACVFAVTGLATLGLVQWSGLRSAGRSGPRGAAPGERGRA